jgi:antirestriction protein ArdC
VSDTVHRMVTERMIAALERGSVPWRKPWQAAAGRPRSMSTGQPYRGVNMFLLALTAAEEGYGSPFWGTYRQIGALGGQVRGGEHSSLAVFWKQAEFERRDLQSGEITVKQLPVLRYYRVFNAAQADHLPERFCTAPGDHSEISQPQAVLDGYLSRGPKLLHVAGDRANYHPATDTIRLPPPSQFNTPQDYYATAFHEAGHSTGHPSRLSRPGIAAFDHFGSDKYAREELVAQMTASILCVETAIDSPAMFENSASYIGGWLSALNRDHRLVVTAAAQAQKACDLITQAEREATRDAADHPGAVVAESESALSTGRIKAPANPHRPRHDQVGRVGPAVERRAGPGPHPHPEASREAEGADAATRAPADPAERATSTKVVASAQSEHAEGSAQQAHRMNRAADWQAEAS